MNAKPLFVLGTLVAAFFVVSLVFISKYNEMSTRLAGLQKKVDHMESAREQVKAPAPAHVPEYEARPADDTGPRVLPPGPSQPAPAVPAPAPTEAQPALTPDQEKAVAKLVERVFKEKYPHLAGEGNAEDQLALLEKELGLDPGQKARIAELWKRMEEEEQALGEELGREMQAGKGNFMDAMPKFAELAKRYDELVKKELSIPQQAKYAELQKAGKIPGPNNLKVMIGGAGPKD